MLMIILAVAITILISRAYWKSKVDALKEEQTNLQNEVQKYIDELSVNNTIWEKRVSSLTERLATLTDINKELVNKTRIPEETVVLNVSSDDGDITVIDVGTEKKQRKRGRKPGTKRPYYKKKLKTKE